MYLFWASNGLLVLLKQIETKTSNICESGSSALRARTEIRGHEEQTSYCSVQDTKFGETETMTRTEVAGIQHWKRKYNVQEPKLLRSSNIRFFYLKTSILNMFA